MKKIYAFPWMILKENWIYLISVLIFCLILSRCTDVEKSINILKVHDYTPIKVGGYEYWRKSVSPPEYRTKFKALNFKGDTVDGVVIINTLFDKSEIIIYN